MPSVPVLHSGCCAHWSHMRGLLLSQSGRRKGRWREPSRCRCRAARTAQHRTFAAALHAHMRAAHRTRTCTAAPLRAACLHACRRAGCHCAGRACRTHRAYCVLGSRTPLLYAANHRCCLCYLRACRCRRTAFHCFSLHLPACCRYTRTAHHNAAFCRAHCRSTTAFSRRTPRLCYRAAALPGFIARRAACALCAAATWL